MAIHYQGDVLQIRINRVKVSCLVLEKTVVGTIRDGDFFLFRRTEFNYYFPLENHLVKKNHVICSGEVGNKRDQRCCYLLLIGDKKVFLVYQTSE